MTKYSIDSTTLSGIADAIRTKKETSDPIAVSDFAEEISTISGGDLPSLPKDPFGADSATFYNMQSYSARSGWYTDNDELYSYIKFKNNASSGHEGICFNLESFNLTSGTQYKISFELTAPSGTTWISGYQYGLKYTSTQVGSGSTSFDLQADVNFTRTVGTQSVEMTFTASSGNYISFLMNSLSGGVTTWMYADKIKIEEVTT